MANECQGKGSKSMRFGHLAHVAQAVGEGAGQHLLDHRHRLVEVVRRRDRLGDLLAVLRLRARYAVASMIAFSSAR